MTDTTEVLTAELVASVGELVVPAAGAEAAAATAPLLPAAERYAASQAAPSTKRTYRSTLRAFALFVDVELGLPATVGAVTLDTVLDYTAWLQDVDEETDEPRCHPRTVAKQLSAIRGFARWLAMIPELRIDPRIQQIRVKAGPPPAPRALTPEQLRTLLAMPDRATLASPRSEAADKRVICRRPATRSVVGRRSRSPTPVIPVQLKSNWTTFLRLGRRGLTTVTERTRATGIDLNALR